MTHGLKILTNFNDLHLNTPVLKAITEAGYETPTPIQLQAIPPLLDGRDLLGIAQTGTGKTLAFAAPLIHHLSRNPKDLPEKSARVLVLAPTRELASQITESFRTYSRFLCLSITTIYGGVKINAQIKRMRRGCDVLVATPGRLIDLMERDAVHLKGVEALVLDEADQMMDMGFIHALRKIVPLLPAERQSLFFSATMPKAIADLAGQFLTDPVQVSVTPESTTAERVDQSVIFVKGPEKPTLLAHCLKQPEVKAALVFARTKHGADKVVRKLKAYDIEAVAIHGNKSQAQREKALHAFRSGQVFVMVATDIAARGIDIPGITHVINTELPQVPEQYVHRIGRTARAGADGRAISFVTGEEKKLLHAIERQTRQRIPVMRIPAELDLAEGQAIEAAHEEKVARAPKPQPRGDKPRGKPGEARRMKQRAGRKPRSDHQRETDYADLVAALEEHDRAPGREPGKVEGRRGKPRPQSKRPHREGRGEGRSTGQGGQGKPRSSAPRAEGGASLQRRRRNPRRQPALQPAE